MAHVTVSVAERKVIKDLLHTYKQFPCLWNTTHELYGNSEAKKQALTIMLDTYRLISEDANLETLKKKIDNLRASYKREHRKVLSNKNHRPSLWYYPYLAFLDEGITISSFKSEEEEGTEISETSQLRHLLSSEAGDNSCTSQICHVMTPDMKIAESYTPEVEESTYTIKTDVSSETDAFGRALGLQLNELSPMQKTIAEKLISEVVFYGRLDKLTTKTSLINLNDDFL